MMTLLKFAALIAVIAGAWFFYLRDQQTTWLVIQLAALFLLMREVRQISAEKRSAPVRPRDEPHDVHDILELPDSRHR